MLNIKLYCILRNRADISLEEQAEQCCSGGADALFLGGHLLPARETVAVGMKIREITRKNKKLFFIGERPDITVAVDADGVRLSHDDVSIDLAKQIIGPRKIVGFVAASMGQAVAAAEEGAGYIMTGPMFSQEKDALGLDIIRLIKKRVKVPVLAFGSINMENIVEVMQSGADGIAVSRAVCGAALISDAAQKFKARVSDLYIKENPSGTKG